MTRRAYTPADLSTLTLPGSAPCANSKCSARVCDDEDCAAFDHGTAHHRFDGDDLGFCADCIDDAEREWLRGRVAELEQHVGSIDAGIEALLRDCRAHLALALRAAETEAYPGHGWRRAVRDTVSVLDGVLGVERGEHREGS